MATRTTVTVGTKFHSAYADSNPTWQVTRNRGKDVWEAKVVNSPDWDGTVKVFTTQEILGSKRLAGAFAKIASDSDKFYAGLKAGEIVHYHNGFQQYIRCIVVKTAKKTVLKRVGLVGNWSTTDLPHRLASGEVYWGFHAKAILKGETFEPAGSNIYECVKKPGLDPRKLPTLDLTIPAPTPEESEKARLSKAIGDINTLVQDRNVSKPKATLESIIKLAQDALATA
jgi:hypothetical protein